MPTSTFTIIDSKSDNEKAIAAVTYIIEDMQMFLDGDWEPDDNSIIATQDMANSVLHYLENISVESRSVI